MRIAPRVGGYDTPIAIGLRRKAHAMGHGPILALGFALGILLGDAATGSARSISSPQIPLAFEANAGQTDPEVKFLARGAGYGAFLTPTGVVLALPVADKGEPAALRIAFAGARRKATLTGLDELPGKANYFTGSDPARWRRDVPTFARVRAHQVYRGVDVVYYASQSRLQFDFVVPQGADPSVIALAVQGPGGIAITPDRDLIVLAAAARGPLQEAVVYPDGDGGR